MENKKRSRSPSPTNRDLSVVPAPPKKKRKEFMVRRFLFPKDDPTVIIYKFLDGQGKSIKREVDPSLKKLVPKTPLKWFLAPLKRAMKTGDIISIN